MDGPSVGERLNLLEARVAAACVAAGRARDSVHLLAISKLQSESRMIEAWAAGQRDFGENYARKALEKQATWSPDREVRWHFVGRLQSNKIKSIANRFAYIHSIDRLDLAERLDRETEARQNIFVQYNVANEASKGGVTDVEALTREIAARCPRLAVCGLMVMPPLASDAQTNRPYFRAAREALARLRREITGHPLDELSMGTSDDFTVAIEEGSTWIRVGSQAFGPRIEK